MQQNHQSRDDLAIINLQDVSDEEENEEERNKITICLSSEKFQINFDKFCKYSGLIQTAFQNKKSIHELIENIEQKFPQYHIKNESAKTFFKLLNNEQIQINSDEYVDLYKMSEIFEVKSLKKLLKKYSMSFSENVQFLLNLLIYQNSDINSNSDENFQLFSFDNVSNDIESLLSKRVNECLKSDIFEKLPISIIYRIIEKSDRKDIQSDLLYDFVMKSDEERLPLLIFVDIKNLSFQKICELSEVGTNKFSEYLPNNFVFMRDLIETNKRLEQENEKLAKGNKKLESDKRQLETQNQKLESDKRQLETQNQKLESDKRQLETQNQKLESDKKQLETQNQKLESDKKQLETQNQKLESDKKQLETQNQKLELDKKQMETVKIQLERKIQELEKDVGKLKVENEMIKKQENEKKDEELKKLKSNSNSKFTKEFEGNYFSGIFNELTQQCNCNIVDKGIINITGNKYINSAPFSTIVDFNFNSKCYYSKDEPNSFVCFDFKNNFVSVSAYSFKASNQPNTPRFLRSWVLEGSNDGNEWIQLDSHENDTRFNSKSQVIYFTIQDESKRNKKFKFIKLRMTGKNDHGDDLLDVFNIELFGSYF